MQLGLHWSVLFSLLLLSACASAPPPASAPLAYQKTPSALEGRLNRAGFKLGDPVFVRIFKQERTLEMWIQGANGRYSLFQRYPICTFSGSLGPKQREGDEQSPEGFYAVGLNQLNPNSRYHRAFNLGYPNAYDRAYGRTGSALMVHGDCVSIGCYAMTDRQISEIYTIVEAALRNGQPFFRVHAMPFRMTEHNLAAHRGSQWYDFWANLKQGYDYFERYRLPPDVQVAGLEYTFQHPNELNRTVAMQQRQDDIKLRLGGGGGG